MSSDQRSNETMNGANNHPGGDVGTYKPALRIEIPIDLERVRGTYADDNYGEFGLFCAGPPQGRLFAQRGPPLVNDHVEINDNSDSNFCLFCTGPPQGVFGRQRTRGLPMSRNRSEFSPRGTTIPVTTNSTGYTPQEHPASSVGFFRPLAGNGESDSPIPCEPRPTSAPKLCDDDLIVSSRHSQDSSGLHPRHNTGHIKVAFRDPFNLYHSDNSSSSSTLPGRLRSPPPLSPTPDDRLTLPSERARLEATAAAAARDERCPLRRERAEVLGAVGWSDDSDENDGEERR